MLAAAGLLLKLGWAPGGFTRGEPLDVFKAIKLAGATYAVGSSEVVSDACNKLRAHVGSDIVTWQLGCTNTMQVVQALRETALREKPAKRRTLGCGACGALVYERRIDEHEVMYNSCCGHRS